MDLEGTLTPENYSAPMDADPKHMKKLLKGNKISGAQNIGYWTGIHLLAGEKPKDFLKRYQKWSKQEISFEQFEKQSNSLWNTFIQDSEFESPEDFLDWYDEKFLNLRERSQELVDLNKDSGYTNAIISHTSTRLSKLAAENLNIEYVVPTWTFDYGTEVFFPTNRSKYADEKASIISEFDESKVRKISFYGNGKNDINIAEKSDEAYMVENREEVNYQKLNAFTGSFEEILRKTRKNRAEEKR